MEPLLVFSNLGFSAAAILMLVLLALLLSSYVKIVTVLAILRVGLGVGSLPSVLVTGGLALVLSFFVMYPVLVESGEAMDSVVRAKQLDQVGADRSFNAQVLDAGITRWKVFLKAHANPQEVKRFIELANELDARNGGPIKRVMPVPAFQGFGQSGDVSPEEASSLRVLAPAFLVSELKEAFTTGLSLFLPFLVIDLIIATLLVSVGYEQLNPLFISFPLKLLLFVSVDGWLLITGNIAATYG